MLKGNSDKKGVNYMARKVVKLEIADFRIVQVQLASLTGALTSMKLGREMKLCDPTNTVMFKGM